jgi:hypothetical protein
MMNCRRNRGLLSLSIVVIALAIPVLGEEVTLQNDSFVTGGSAMIVGDFASGEQAGVRLTAPCDGAIVEVQIGWLSASGETGQSFERAIHVYEGNTFPTPGTELLLLEGPVLTDGALNQFRYLDEQGTIPINIPISMGEQFYVTLEFENPTDIANGTPSVFRDLDGCHAQSNVLYAIPGGWLNFCSFLAGDLVIRAVVACDEMQGACCLADGACVVLPASDCTAQGGTYQGDGVSCSSVECPQPVEACCFELTGGCLDLTEHDCLTAGGIPAGVGTECASHVCFPTGACCLTDATCQDALSPEECAALGGVFQGDGTDCATTACPEPTGACCFSAGGCLVFTAANCAVAGGTWTGPGTDCADDNDNGTADACESGCLNGGDSGNHCTADIDGSGDCLVNLADLAQLLGHYGMSAGATHEEGDIEPLGGDGDVDLGDLAALLGQYGDDCN